MTEVWSAVVTAVLSAGFAATVTAFYTSKASARKINAEAKKLEVEADAAEISVSPGVTNMKGAEAAVLLMESALKSSHGEIARLNDARKADHEYIKSLTRRVEELQSLVEAAQESARKAQEYSTGLRRELEEARTRMAD